jgi:hypothetical protein
LSLKPVRGLLFSASYKDALHGEGSDLSDTDYQNRMISASASYEIINNAYVYLEYQRNQVTGDVKYTPSLFLGNTNNLVAGINIGF